MMRALLVVMAMVLFFAADRPAGAETGFDVGASFVDGNLSGFHLALGEYFHVPQREIVAIRDRRRMPDHDLPVALFIAQRARITPGLVIDMRLSGRSWMDISLHYGLGPEIFYVPVERDYGPPYGKAYGYYKKKHRKDWREIRLDDDDVVNMVNLRFLSEHYGHSPDEIIRMRSEGREFTAIDDEFRGRREKSRRERGGSADEQRGGGSGGGRSKERKGGHSGGGKGRHDR